MAEEHDYFNSVNNNQTNGGTKVYYVQSQNSTKIPEAILNILAWVILIVGIILSIVLMVAMLDSRWVNGGAAFMTFILGCCISGVMWAVIKVVVNISNNLHSIKEHLERTNL